MRSKLILWVLLGVVTMAFAKEPRAGQSGKLVQMNSVPCGTDEKDATSVAGDVFPTDSGQSKARYSLCSEYVLQTEDVTYHIRSRDNKHPILLPFSTRAQFRIEKDTMVLRVEDLDNKDREYTVVSMTPRSESSRAEVSLPRLNHLQ